MEYKSMDRGNGKYIEQMAWLKKNSFCIYGTGIIGVSLYEALKELYGVTPVSFLVTSAEDNPAQIEQIPVQEAAGVSLGDRLILAAAPAEHHNAIRRTLQDLGVAESDIIYVDSALENQIMEKYYASLPEFETARKALARQGAGYVEITENNSALQESQSGESEAHIRTDICVYQAKCHVDRPMANMVTLPAYVRPIQVGAALTEQSAADLKDDTGDNISHKNADYCELTATYYAWKNSGAAYKGLCHYRRVFGLGDVQMEMLLGEGGTDVLLPYPTIHLPDISRQHSRYISEPEWLAMRRAVEECEPAYAADFDSIFSDKYFYNFNMLVAKADIFDEYAEWLFGILERTEEIIKAQRINTTKRYAGYLGENLTTLYFRKNKSRFRILHVGKVHLL